MTSDHNLVLTGFMGTGKTTVGRALAGRLDMEFVDTDQIIESRHGPIGRIFADRGETTFRQFEREVARELGQRRGLVIATGGRLILDPENYRALSRNSRIFCLVATPEEVHHRVVNDRSRLDRPLLGGDDPRDRIVALMAERQQEYARFPQLSTGHGDPTAIAEEMARLWHAHDSYDMAGSGGEGAYTVGVGILSLVRQLAMVGGPMVVIADERAGALYAPNLGETELTIVVPAGGARDPQGAGRSAIDQVREAGVGETATVVALGSSGALDIARRVAALYGRGLDLVHCPTDLVAMVGTTLTDGGLPVLAGRDPIGFHPQPRAVLTDVGTLQTLSRHDFASGLAQIVRLGLVADPSLVAQIEATSWSTGELRLPRMLAGVQSLVAQTVEVGLDLARAMRQDAARQDVLLLGQAFSHAIVSASQGKISPDEAVAMGMVGAAHLSHLRGHASEDLATRVAGLVQHIGLRPGLPSSIEPEAILSALRHDRQSGPRFVLLRDVGDPFVADDVTESELRTVLQALATTEDPSATATA